MNQLFNLLARYPKAPPKLKEGETPPPPAYEVIARSVVVMAKAEAPLPLGVTDTVHVELDTQIRQPFLGFKTCSHSNVQTAW